MWGPARPASGSFALENSRAPAGPWVVPMCREGPTVWEGVRSGMVGVQRRCPAAPQNDVEVVGQRPLGPCGFEVKSADHALARLGIGHRVEDGIKWEERITGKIHLRHEP